MHPSPPITSLIINPFVEVLLAMSAYIQFHANKQALGRIPFMLEHGILPLHKCAPKNVSFEGKIEPRN